MKPTARNAVSGSVLLIVAIGTLNALLAVHRWLPDPRLLTLLAPTPETIAAILLLGAVVVLARRSGRLIVLFVALVLAVLFLFGVGEGFYQLIFRKEFVPWTDLVFLPALLNMVLATELFSNPLFAVTPVVVLAAIIWLLIYGLLSWIRSLLVTSTRVALVAPGAVFAGMAVMLAIAGYSEPLAIRAARQLRPPENLALEEIVEPDPPAVTDPPAIADPQEQFQFRALRDANIHLLIVESYGHTLESNPEHRELIQPVYDRLNTVLAVSGFEVFSGYLVSPAFGGRSWLADSTILTGIFIESQHDYDQILQTATRNLTHLLGDAGYHRVLAAPGTYEADGEWRSFYEFDEYLFRYDFGYNGPFISFGAMPDQYLMYRTYERVRAVVGPVFVNYVLVSSHVPFDTLPQFVDDWERLSDGSIFNELSPRKFDNNWLAGGEYPEGYVASIEYTLRSITSYITEIVADDSLFIVVGDHQPRRPISEADATFSVPVHAIGKNQELVRSFSQFGWNQGLKPTRDLPHPGLDTLFGSILDVINGRVKYSEDSDR